MDLSQSADLGKCYQKQDWRCPHGGCDTYNHATKKHSGEGKLPKPPVILKVSFFTKRAKEKIKSRKRGLAEKNALKILVA